MKNNLKILFITSITLILNGCGNENDPGDKLFWTIFGFPLLGLAYFIGGAIMTIFQSEKRKKENEAPEPIPGIIIGLIVLGIIYSLFKGLVK